MEELRFPPFGRRWTHDVFLSFRGRDTRKGFTGFLYHVLRQRGINVFIADEKLCTGEEISPALLRAIQESRIAIIVFSKNYASSTWCLDELVKILQCKKTSGQMVWPVFYNVDPSEVRHQRASFGMAMAKHEARFEDDTEKLQNWKRALFEAANLSGWSLDNGYEFELIETIVKQVSRKLHRTLLYISDYTVGLETRVSEMKSLLYIGPGEHIRMVGIYGLGDIGKTTIARALFNLISDQFEHACFLADIREYSIEKGLVRLQQRLLYDLFGEKNIKLGNIDMGISIIKNRLRGKKVLLILDDIDKLHQLTVLAGDRNWFGFGSVIIITTRHKYLLAVHDVEKTYEVKKLNHDEAFELFTWNAFKSKAPDADYMEISNRLVLLSERHPLVLKVLGSYLYGRTVDEWKSAVHKFKNVPCRLVQDVLRMSYDDLGEKEKEIFLDIACFFNGETMKYVKKTLVACGYYNIYGLYVLIERSLIYIDEYSRVRMPDLVRDMGREIVRQESPSEPGKRSRLWDHQDVLQVLSKNIGSDRIQCMLVDLLDQYKVHLSDETFEMMTNLRVLIVRNAQFYGSPQRLPWSLRLLDWMEYPSISLQSRKVALLNLHHNGLSKPAPLEIGTVKCCGIHLYNEGMNIHVVSFMNSGLRGSNLVYEKVDGALGIFEEEEEEDDDEDEEEEEYGNDDLEADELSISINHQIPESYETETRSKEKGVSVYGSNAEETLDDKLNKLFLRSSSLATSIYEDKKKLELWSKGKLKDNIVQVQASTSKCNCYNKAERTQIQVPEKRANEEFSQIEDNMEAFYASIEAESSILPLLQDSVNTRPSEETEKKLQNLQDLILKNFSLLLHPERSGHLNNVIDYLLSLSPEDGISLKMRSAMLRLSTTFSQWSSDYNDANLKLESATEILSNVKKLEEGLETNVKEFRKAEKSGNAVCSELANLKTRKRELKEQINAMKAEIADSKLDRDDAVQRKRELFEKGRMIKAQKDDLENKVPQLRAEQEGARITLATIESEWSKLVKQFIEGFFSSPLLASLN